MRETLRWLRRLTFRSVLNKGMQIFTSSVINLNFHAKLSLRVEWLKIGKSNIYDFWNLHYIFFYLELMEGGSKYGRRDDSFCKITIQGGGGRYFS